MERIFGFELLPAPFVVAHLQLGILLQNFGLPLDDTKSERAAIYLTNALTGWEPPTEEAKRQLTFAIPEFRQEKEAADAIKQEKRIIVILGNPPYNGFAGIALEEERDLSTAYRTTKHAPAPQGQGLNDLYIRFFRMAERRIVEKSGEGIVCFISNYSWLDGLSFTGMRERYLEVFDGITVDCLNGDKYKTGKLTPEGAPDPSVFSTEHNREGIQVGTAIVTLVKKPGSARVPRAGFGVPPKRTSTDTHSQETHAESLQTPREVRGGGTPPPARGTRALPAIRFRHLWGKDKRVDLLESLGKPAAKVYQTLTPPVAVGLPFLPSKTSAGFFKWPLLTELFPVSFPGVKTSRDEALVTMDRATLEAQMDKYFDPKVSHEEMRRLCPGLMEKTRFFAADEIRDVLRKRGREAGHIIRYIYRPLDARWLFWEAETKLLDRNRAPYMAQIFDGNIWLSAGQRNRKEDFYQPQVTSCLADHHLVESNVGMIPLYLRDLADTQSARVQETPDMFTEVGGGRDDVIKPNLTPAASTYLAKLGAQPDALFFHSVAVLHSPSYRGENAGALRQDWPRVPLPKSRHGLLASAELGKQVATLLDTETPVVGVNAGKVRADLVKIAVVTRLTKETLNLSLTAGWGHAGQGRVTPGKGKLDSRNYAADERPATEALALFGAATCDIYLNAAACWRNVPANVWDYTIGGYQVLKKWLSYREHALLGRALTADEAREFTHNARRIAALLLLQPDLDRNYQAVKAAAAVWTDFSPA